MKTPTPQHRLAPARLNFVVPVLWTAALGHAGIARLRRRALVAALRAASDPFPPSPFQIW